AFLVARSRIARLDLVGVTAVLDTERHVQRAGHADVEVAADVECRSPLRRLEVARVERGWRRASIVEQRDVAGRNRVDAHEIAAIAAREIVAPLTRDLAFDADGGAVVTLLRLLLRIETERVEGRQTIRRAVVLERLCVLLAVAPLRVELHGVAEVDPGIQRSDGEVVARIAMNLVDVRIPVRAR